MRRTGLRALFRQVTTEYVAQLSDPTAEAGGQAGIEPASDRRAVEAASGEFEPAAGPFPVLEGAGLDPAEPYVLPGVSSTARSLLSVTMLFSLSAGTNTVPSPPASAFPIPSGSESVRGSGTFLDP